MGEFLPTSALLNLNSAAVKPLVKQRPPLRALKPLDAWGHWSFPDLPGLPLTVPSRCGSSVYHNDDETILSSGQKASQACGRLTTRLDNPSQEKRPT